MGPVVKARLQADVRMMYNSPLATEIVRLEAKARDEDVPLTTRSAILGRLVKLKACLVCPPVIPTTCTTAMFLGEGDGVDPHWDEHGVGCTMQTWLQVVLVSLCHQTYASTRQHFVAWSQVGDVSGPFVLYQYLCYIEPGCGSQLFYNSRYIAHGSPRVPGNGVDGARRLGISCDNRRAVLTRALHIALDEGSPTWMEAPAMSGRHVTWDGT